MTWGINFLVFICKHDSLEDSLVGYIQSSPRLATFSAARGFQKLSIRYFIGSWKCQIESCTGKRRSGQ